MGSNQRNLFVGQPLVIHNLVLRVVEILDDGRRVRVSVEAPDGAKPFFVPTSDRGPVHLTIDRQRA